MYLLYHHPYSQHARRVVSLFEIAGIPYSLSHVAMEDNAHLAAPFLAINPNHQIPVLVDGDFVLYESNAILRYLCQRHSLIEWYPADISRRAKLEQWLDWNQCRLAQPVVDLFLNKMFLGDQADSAAIARAESQLGAILSVLDDALAGTEFLIGTAPTIADLSVASNITQLQLAGGLNGRPNVTRWYQRMEAIEGFRRSLPSI